MSILPLMPTSRQVLCFPDFSLAPFFHSPTLLSFLMKILFPFSLHSVFCLKCMFPPLFTTLLCLPPLVIFLLPAQVSAGIKPTSIVSYNHLGNNDGRNLSAPQQFRSKEISKSNVVDDMVDSNKMLYKEGEHPDHVVSVGLVCCAAVALVVVVVVVVGLADMPGGGFAERVFDPKTRRLFSGCWVCFWIPGLFWDTGSCFRVLGLI